MENAKKYRHGGAPSLYTGQSGVSQLNWTLVDFIREQQGKGKDSVGVRRMLREQFGVRIRTKTIQRVMDNESWREERRVAESNNGFTPVYKENRLESVIAFSNELRELWSHNYTRIQLRRKRKTIKDLADKYHINYTSAYKIRDGILYNEYTHMRGVYDEYLRRTCVDRDHRRMPQKTAKKEVKILTGYIPLTASVEYDKYKATASG